MNKRDRSLMHLFQLGLSIHHLSQTTERKFGLSLGQWCFLRHLIDLPGTTANALALAVGVHSSTLTQTMKKMEEKGYVSIAEDPKDSRKRLISITRRGKEALEDSDRAWSTYGEQISGMEGDVSKLADLLSNHSLVKE
jgi:DNA-binding MarR family transcriptional regulator